MRRYLVTQNELASIVVGTVERPTPDTKRLRIDVTPGASVAGREIRFTGNEAVETKALQAEVTASGIDVEAWVDRTVLVRELQTCTTSRAT